MTGYPSVTTINCSANSSAVFEREGVAVGGSFQMFISRGSIRYSNATTRATASAEPDQVIDMMGSSLWVSEGTFMRVRVDGFVYVVGADFVLQPASQRRPAVFTSSYAGPTMRAYRAAEAIANSSNGVNVHDPHINNGTTNARDLAWFSNTGVDPPSITVINCAPASAGDSFVWFHFHPAGAIYLPHAGNICFQTDRNICVEPGEARWTSPNLYYYESFVKPRVADVEAQRLVRAALTPANASACGNGVVFSVTNFDPASAAGVPNFVDVPENAVRGKKWGTFQNMMVHRTTVSSAAVSVDPQDRKSVV